MKRVGLSLLVIVVLFFGVVISDPNPAKLQAQKRTVDQVNQEIRQAQARAAEAKKRQAEAAKERVEVQRQRESTLKELERIRDEKVKIEGELIAQENRIDLSEQNLAETELELEEAIERINARDDLLRNRVKLVYMNGTVSYLDVLMKSTSFADFLDRYNAIRSLVGQDKEILESNKRDRILVEEKKEDIESQLEVLNAEYVLLGQLRDDFLEREHQSEVMIAQLNVQEEELEHISEEEERRLLEETARERALLNERQKLIYSGGIFQFPLPLDSGFRKTSDYGTRVDPITGRKGAYHNGVDFGVARGTSILAAEGGQVIRSEWYGSFGNAVIIDHGSGIWTLYAHASKLNVKKNEFVKKGQKIAEVGSTGRSTGNHLHFSVYLNGQAVDPSKYLKY